MRNILIIEASDFYPWAMSALINGDLQKQAHKGKENRNER